MSPDQIGFGTCGRCREAFPPTELKRASIPSMNAFAAIFVSTDGEQGPISCSRLVDPHQYCSACCLRVNFRRLCTVLFLGGTMILATVVASRWLL